MSWVDKHLERLDRLVDVRHVKASQRLQEAAWRYESIDRLPRCVNLYDLMSKERYGNTDWPVFLYKEAFEDPDKMLLNQLSAVYEGALIGDDKMYTIRANYGNPILASMLGCEWVIAEEDSFPWVKHLETESEIKACIDRGVPDLDTGIYPRVVETEEYWLEKLSQYPNLEETVHVYMCDNGGPFNGAGTIVGQRMYTLILDDPKLAHNLIDLITETSILIAKDQKRVIGEPLDSGFHSHFRLLDAGVRINEDYALYISEEAYEEFVLPYNEKLFSAFGGGFLLYCGEGSHLWDLIFETEGLNGFLIWSEDPNDLLEVRKRAAPKEVCVMWQGPFPSKFREKVKTGTLLDCKARSIDEGKRIMEGNVDVTLPTLTSGEG